MRREHGLGFEQWRGARMPPSRAHLSTHVFSPGLCAACGGRRGRRIVEGQQKLQYAENNGLADARRTRGRPAATEAKQDTTTRLAAKEAPV